MIGGEFGWFFFSHSFAFTIEQSHRVRWETVLSRPLAANHVTRI